jgi:hypothetical protein
MNPLTPLVIRSQRALHLSQGGLGDLLGASRRTVTRWVDGTSPSAAQLDRLTRAVFAVDQGLAGQLAEARGQSLVSLGLVPPPSPPALEVAPLPTPAPAPLPARCLADSIVCAAVDVAGMTPAQLRPVLLAAFERAAELRIGVDEIVKGLGTTA